MTMKLKNKNFLTLPLYTSYMKCILRARQALVLSADTKRDAVKTCIICFSNLISTLLPWKYANIGTISFVSRVYDIRGDLLFIFHMSDAIEGKRESLTCYQSASFLKKISLVFYESKLLVKFQTPHSTPYNPQR